MSFFETFPPPGVLCSPCTLSLIGGQEDGCLTIEIGFFFLF